MTPPIAKEPEVTGLSEVREKLEEARLIILRGAHGEKARVAMRRGAVDNIDKALALLESEQGKQPKVVLGNKFCECGSDLIHECGNPRCMNGQENREDWEREDE